jgi:hypothetical protein
MRDDRAIAALRREPDKRIEEVELVVIRDRGRDVELVLDDGETLVFDVRELRFAIEDLEPPCTCGSAGPDADGNYDQIENPDCPRHGWHEAAA